MDSKTPYSVAVILVNWNGYYLTKRCLHSLEKVSYVNHSIIVVDNASEDGSYNKLKNEFNKPIFLRNQKNLGFTGGNNTGIAYAMEKGFDYILLLNNDTVVNPDFMEPLLNLAIQNPDTGMVQPLILNLDSADRIWSAGGKMLQSLGIAKTLGDNAVLKDYPLEDRKIDWATGCCILIPKVIILQVGTLENSFFAYFEDVDWSLRIREAGFKIYFSSKSIIYHQGSASSKKAHDEGVLSPKVFYLHARNQLFLLRRHSRFPEAILSWTYHFLKYVAWMSYFCLRGRFKKMKSVARGIRDGILLDHHHPDPLCP
jgi:GT2 family glycosyltransferase